VCVRERERDRKREGRGSTSLGVSRPEWRVPRTHAIQIKTGPRPVMLAKRIARLEDCAWVVTRMGGLRMDRRTMGGRACTAARWDCPHITPRWDMITARGYPTGLLLANACCARRACSSAAEPWTGGSRGGEVMLAIACCARRTCSRACRA
jgi:hypothetical protein